MGGSSKKQTTGYKYRVGIHSILGTGVADAILRIVVDEKKAWERTRLTDANTTISIDEEDLFGGETKEGGVVGDLDFQSGTPTQTTNSYLQSVIGGIVPSYRGVIGVILKNMYIGTNPYLKGWQIRTQRLHKTSDNVTQWYDAKSSIFIGKSDTTRIISETDTFSVKEMVVDSETLDVLEIIVDDDLPGPFGWSTQGNQFDGDGTQLLFFDGVYSGGNDEPDFAYPNSIMWQPGNSFEAIKEFTLEEDAALLRFYGLFVASSSYPVHLFLDDVEIYSDTRGGLQPKEFDVYATYVESGTHTIKFTADDVEVGLPFDVNLFAIRVDNVPHGFEAMNPIHIIRECLTDVNWGMGYDPAAIDDVSFMAAADILHDEEEVALCLLWDQQGSIEKFIDKVKSHINAELYVDRVTGLFTMTVSYYDMAIGNTSTITVQDIALAAEQGNVIAASIEYDGFPTAEMASKAAQRDLVSVSTPLISCTVYTSVNNVNFNMGSVFKLSWAKYGISNVVMRVTGINFGDGKNNAVKMECVQDVFTSPTASMIPNSESLWVDPHQKPTIITDQLAVEVPYLEMVQSASQSVVDNILSENPYTGYIGVSAIKPLTGFNARLHTDSGAGYVSSSVVDFCPNAILSNDINKTQTTINIHNMVRVTEVVPLGTWFQIDEELLSIESLPDVDGLMTVKRGLLDTIPADHLADAVVFFWDEWAQTDNVEYGTGDEVNVKLTNITSSGETNLNNSVISTVAFDNRAIRPYPPGNFQLNAQYFPAEVVGDIVLTWAHRNRIQQTSGVYLDYYSASVTTEVGVTYNARLKQGETLIDETTGLTGTTTTFTGNPAGEYTIEIESERDGFVNFQLISHTFTYAPDILVSSIESEEEFGIPTVFESINPASIESEAEFGVPTLTQNTLPTSIESGEEFGTPTLTIDIQPSSIESGEEFGTPDVSTNYLLPDTELTPITEMGDFK
jgi:hypothetical protein